jgi:hypothetical protein
MTRSTFNLYNNFKAKHLQSTNHVKNWCVKNDVNYQDHPQSITPNGKGVHLTLQKVTHEGYDIWVVIL